MFRTALAALGVCCAPAPASTLIYCSEASPEGFTPALYTSATTWDASSKQLFNRLVEFERGGLRIVPALAESWQVSSDGLRYTFSLRRGVRFHRQPGFNPTRDLNADDVVFSADRQRDPNHPYHRIGGASWAMFESLGMGKTINRIEKIDPLTVRFVLNEPSAPFLANLAMDFMSIHSAEYAAALLDRGQPELFDLAPVGTGPFQLVKYQKDSVIHYRANPDYWAGRAAIDRLVFAITPDSAVRLQKLLAGECHVMPYPNPADLPALAAASEIELLEQPGLNIGYLAFHTRKPPLDDVRVRRALVMAINKDAIIESIYAGAGVPAKNPIPPTLWSFNDMIEDYPYDPGGARELLTEAGLADGFDTDIWAMPVQRPYNPNARRMAELIQNDWARIGVRARIVSYEWGEYLKRSRNGEHRTILLGWSGQNGDPDNFLYTLLGCASVNEANRARWCHPEFDGLITRARRTVDRDDRRRMYERAQEIFKDQAPWATIAHSKVVLAIRRSVAGYVMDPLGGHSFYGVRLTPD